MNRTSTLTRTGFKTPANWSKAPRKTIRAKSKKRVTHEASPAGQDDKWYKGEVKKRPCCVCVAFGLTQTSPTDAHHPICERYSTERVPDRECIPLCKCHHQGLRFDRDKSKLAIHQGKESWMASHGSDRAYIDVTQGFILGDNHLTDTQK
mgnify:CR=1 FL=1|tara:strand:+ start:4240 stop:4689 length:450 start_codon:yes stop_codon:yes gene_type:complete